MRLDLWSTLLLKRPNDRSTVLCGGRCVCTAPCVACGRLTWPIGYPLSFILCEVNIERSELSEKLRPHQRKIPSTDDSDHLSHVIIL